MNSFKYILSIAAGATLLAVSCKDTVEPSATAVTYESEVAKLMTNYCISCHSGSKPADGIDLTTYEGVKEQAQKGEITEKMNDENDPMPPSGMLAESKRKIIDNWISNGMPEK